MRELSGTKQNRAQRELKKWIEGLSDADKKRLNIPPNYEHNKNQGVN